MATIIEEIYCPKCGLKIDDYYRNTHKMVPEKCPGCNRLLKRRIKLEKAP